MVKKGILDRLGEGIVLGDGGYIVELEQRSSLKACRRAAMAIHGASCDV